jgi:tripartite-type tricarboxylate transporter receptor subunit TctC
VGTAAAIIDKLSTEIIAGVGDPNLKGRLLALGVEPVPMPPITFGKFIADETEKWAKVIKFANIKPE